MESPSAIPPVGRLETELPSSRIRVPEAGKESGALRLAWTPSRGSHHGSSRNKLLGTEDRAGAKLLASFAAFLVRLRIGVCISSSPCAALARRLLLLSVFTLLR